MYDRCLTMPMGHTTKAQREGMPKAQRYGKHSAGYGREHMGTAFGRPPFTHSGVGTMRKTRYIVSGENNAGRYVHFEVDATCETEALEIFEKHPQSTGLCCFSACHISEATRYERDHAVILSHF